MKHRIVSLLALAVLLISCEEALYTEEVDSDQPYYREIDDYTLDATIHLVRDIPTMASDKMVNVVVEIPAGTLEKWEVNKESGDLQWEIKSGDPRVVDYLGYPGNYGFIPQTLLPGDAGGDGDPLDVVILGPSVPRGIVMETKIIGMIKMLDRGEQDDKLIAVAKGTPFSKMSSMEELNASFPGTIDILSTWFANYKGEGKMEILGIGEKSDALQTLDSARKAYAKN